MSICERNYVRADSEGVGSEQARVSSKYETLYVPEGFTTLTGEVLRHQQAKPQTASSLSVRPEALCKFPQLSTIQLIQNLSTPPLL